MVEIVVVENWTEPPHTYTPPEETVFFNTYRALNHPSLAGVSRMSDKSPPMSPFKVHIVGRTGVDSYLVLVVSGYGTLGPELVKGGRGGGVGIYLFSVLLS